MSDPISASIIAAATTTTVVQFRAIIADAIGGLVRPWQIKRVGAAEAEVEKLMAVTKVETDIEITERKRRAMGRFVNEETQRQANMEAISEKASLQISDAARPNEMNKDWIAHFFEKARLISDDEMQALWAKVLAGEAEQPGRFSKRTIDALALLEKNDAEYFMALCRFVWLTKEALPVPLIYNLYPPPFIKETGLTFGRLQYLEGNGFIIVRDASACAQRWEPPQQVVSYFDKSVQVILSRGATEFIMGRVMFTRIGYDLFSICRAEPIDGFFQETIDIWSNTYKYEVKPVPGTSPKFPETGSPSDGISTVPPKTEPPRWS